MDESTVRAVNEDRLQALGWAIYRRRMPRTQVEFAQLLGVSQGAVSLWEAGRTNLNIETINRIEGKLRVYPGTLLIEAGYVDRRLLEGDAAARLVALRLLEHVVERFRVEHALTQDTGEGANA